MAESPARICNLILNSGTYSWSPLCAPSAAGTVSAGALESFSDGIDNFLIGIELDFHVRHLFLVKAYIGNIASLEALLTGIDQTSINQALAKEYSDHITDNERRLEQVLEFKARLYESLVGGMLTKEEYASYKAKYTKQAEDIRESVRVLKEKLTEVLENRSERNRWISQFTQFSTLETLDRRALIHMVQSIRVRGKKELDITFTHEDEYKKALQLLTLAAQQKDYEQRKVG